jgi:preprotein translocase subunit SecF
VHDLLITVGIYALAGFEITPASVIGFLTILGYSLYDTVVVFDKVRENTSEAVANGRKSYSQAANLAVNQTLVRSINTSVVALLPVAAILVVGFTVLGPGTLLDLSLALFVGIAVGTYSSIFIATPILADLREREPAMQQLRKRAERYQASHARGAQDVEAGHGRPDEGSGTPAGRPQDAVPAARAAGTPRVSTGRPVHPYAQPGPRNQPRRPPKSKR